MAVGGGSTARVRWLSDQDKNVLLSNFEKRGWVKGSHEGQVKGYVEYLATMATVLVGGVQMLMLVHGASCDSCAILYFADGDWNFYWYVRATKTIV